MYRLFGWLFIIIGLLIGLIITIVGNYIDINAHFDPDILAKYGSFIGGTVGVFFSLAGYFIIYEGIRTNKINQYENTFFNLIASFNEFRTQNIGLKKKLEGGLFEYVKGSEFFEVIMHEQINPRGIPIKNIDNQLIKKQLAIHKNQLSQFYGQLNMIIYKVENSKLREKEKIFYIEYLKSILSRIEIFLILKWDLIFPNNEYKYLSVLNFTQAELS